MRRDGAVTEREKRERECIRWGRVERERERGWGINEGEKKQHEIGCGGIDVILVWWVK
jgi:hypothetical protein